MPNIIKTMQLLNYSPDRLGVCFGIAAMAAQASFRKGHDVFANRIQRIRNYSEAQIETINNQKSHLDEKLELWCFFDGLSIYHGRTSVKSEFASIVSENQNFDDMPRIMTSETSEENDELIYPEIKASIVNAFTFQEFLNFVQKVKKYFGQQAFSIMLRHSPINHTTHIGFDGEKWLSTNNDSVILGEDNPKDIKKVVSNAFLLMRNVATNQMSVLINILQPRGSKTDLKALEVHDFSLEKITDSFDKKTLSYLLASYVKAARYDLLLTVFDKIKSLKLTEAEKIELIESKRLNNTTLFHWLANSSEERVFSQMLNIIDELGLSPETKIDILAKKDKCDSSALFYAVKNGSEDLVKLILKTSSLIKDENIKAEFLSARNNEGISVLFLAVQHKFENIVKLLLDASSFFHDEKFKIDLLNAKNNDGVPALFLAAYAGYGKILKHLLKAILSITNKEAQFELLHAKVLGTPALHMAATKEHEASVLELLIAFLSVEDKNAQYKLLSSKHNNSIPVLFQTTSENQNSITKLLIKAYCLVEDEDLRAKLLSAKDEYNMTALFKAVINENEEILIMLLDAILFFEDTMIQSMLLNAQYNDKSPLYVASRDGIENIVNLILETILLVKDEKAQVELLSAYFHDKSALYIASRYGYKNIVKLFLEAINSIEDKESRINLITALDDYDCSAASIAKENDHKSIAKLLNKAIKKETQDCNSCIIL